MLRQKIVKILINSVEQVEVEGAMGLTEDVLNVEKAANEIQDLIFEQIKAATGGKNGN
jgi:hypothetical protein